MFIAANKLLIANLIQDHSQTKIQQLFSVCAILILFLLINFLTPYFYL
jgi:hypothetical protein